MSILAGKNSIYRPDYSREEDPRRIEKLIRRYPFATLVSHHPERGLFVSHIPITLRGALPGGPLIAHLARSNPHWKDLAEAGDALVIFRGPSAYVTPRWYRNPLNVPTWNYAVVQIRGKVRLVEEEGEVARILNEQTKVFEGESEQAWKMGDLPADFSGRLVSAVMGLEISIDRVEAKFKLSQNREEEDRQGVIEGLRTRGDEASQSVLELMRGEGVEGGRKSPR